MRTTRVLCLFLVVSISLSYQWCEISYANESLPAGRESLIDKYQKIKKELEKISFAIPFLDTNRKNKRKALALFMISSINFSMTPGIFNDQEPYLRDSHRHFLNNWNNW